jgi:hypothetical protein
LLGFGAHLATERTRPATRVGQRAVFRARPRQEVVARFAAALGGRLHQAIYFDDGDIAAIA